MLFSTLYSAPFGGLIADGTIYVPVFFRITRSSVPVVRSQDYAEEAYNSRGSSLHISSNTCCPERSTE